MLSSVSVLTAITIMQLLRALPRNPGIMLGRVFIGHYRNQHPARELCGKSLIRGARGGFRNFGNGHFGDSFLSFTLFQPLL